MMQETNIMTQPKLKKRGSIDTEQDIVKTRLVIGDIHGHIEPFKSIYEKEDPDDVIILGDYFDNFHGSDKEIVDCFKSILSMQKKHKKGEFILLIGNHDFHYMDLTEAYSGKRKSYTLSVSMMLDKCMEDGLLKWVYVDSKNKTVYSHAGITNKWLAENRLFISDLNDLNDIDSRKFRFTFEGDETGYETGYGTGPFASPLWVRPDTLVKDMYIDDGGSKWTQIVGHTHGKAKTLMADETWIYGCTAYINKPGTEEEFVYMPILHVIDSLPDYYIVEKLNSNDELLSREVKSTNVTVDPLVNSQIILKKATERDEDIKKLAEACGIKLSTPI